MAVAFVIESVTFASVLTVTKCQDTVLAYTSVVSLTDTCMSLILGQ